MKKSIIGIAINVATQSKAMLEYQMSSTQQPSCAVCCPSMWGANLNLFDRPHSIEEIALSPWGQLVFPPPNLSHEDK